MDQVMIDEIHMPEFQNLLQTDKNVDTGISLF